jgi:hypothetical protein
MTASKQPEIPFLVSLVRLAPECRRTKQGQGHGKVADRASIANQCVIPAIFRACPRESVGRESTPPLLDAR